MLWDRKNHLLEQVHVAHVHECLWRSSFHAECLSQGVNTYVHIVGSPNQKRVEHTASVVKSRLWRVGREYHTIPESIYMLKCAKLSGARKNTRECGESRTRISRYESTFTLKLRVVVGCVETTSECGEKTVRQGKWKQRARSENWKCT